MTLYCKGDICHRRKECHRAQAWDAHPEMHEAETGPASGFWIVDERECMKQNYQDGVFDDKPAEEPADKQAEEPKTEQPEQPDAEQDQPDKEAMKQEYAEFNQKVISECKGFASDIRKRVITYRALKAAWIVVTVFIGATAVLWAITGHWLNAACNAAWVGIALLRIYDQRSLARYGDITIRFIEHNIDLRHKVNNYMSLTKDYKDQIATYKELHGTYQQLSKSLEAQIVQQEGTINKLLSILDMCKPENDKEE